MQEHLLTCDALKELFKRCDYVIHVKDRTVQKLVNKIGKMPKA